MFSNVSDLHRGFYFQCDPGNGADAFYDFVYRKPTLTMVIGSSCSEVTETIGEIAPYWNLVLVSTQCVIFIKVSY